MEKLKMGERDNRKMEKQHDNNGKIRQKELGQ